MATGVTAHAATGHSKSTAKGHTRKQDAVPRSNPVARIFFLLASLQ
jgi:hypothetical protein